MNKKRNIRENKVSIDGINYIPVIEEYNGFDNWEVLGVDIDKLPIEEKNLLNEWLYGQTVLVVEDIELCYIWDYARFDRWNKGKVNEGDKVIEKIENDIKVLNKVLDDIETLEKGI